MARHMQVLNTIVDVGRVPVLTMAMSRSRKRLSMPKPKSARIEFTNRGDVAPFVFNEQSEYGTKSIPSDGRVGSIVGPFTASLHVDRCRLRCRPEL